MERKHTFSKFIYLDTNILSELAKKKLPWKPLRDFLIKNDLTIAITGQHLVELAPVQKLHDELVNLLLLLPSAYIKPWDMILREELESHPEKRKDSLLLTPLNSMLLENNGVKKLSNQISSEKITRSNIDQTNYAKKMLKRFNQLKENFSPQFGSKYILKDENLFTFCIVVQWLKDYDEDFLLTFKEDATKININSFRSIQLYAQLIFYKYYLGNREPKDLSDFGDLAHLHAIPYCEYAIIEKDNCNILNQIKRNENTLNLTTIKKMKFIRELAYPPTVH